MELGFNFEDTDFVEKPKDKPLLTSYNAKICSPKWFLKDDADDGTTDKATLYKFKGDYFYKVAQYNSAIQDYTISLASLGVQNRTMRREMTESLARCYVQTGQFSLAQETAFKMVPDCLTVDQMCQALLLQQLIYKHAGCVKQELNIVQQLVEAHPFNSQFWMMLAEVYVQIQAWMETHGIKPSSQSHLCNLKSETDSEKSTEVASFCSNSQKSECSLNSDGLIRKNIDETQSLGSSGTCNNVGAADQDVVEVTDESAISSELQTGLSTCQCDQLLTGFPCNLMQLTCYIRIQLILQSVQDTVGSFIKDRNTQVFNMLEEKIHGLTSKEDLIHTAKEFMKADMFEDAFYGRDAGDRDTEDVKWTGDKKLSFEEFNQKWFSWTKDLSQEQVLS